MPVFKISASLLIYFLRYIISKLYPILAYAKSFTEKLALLFETNSFQSLVNFNVKKKSKSLCSSPYNGQHKVLLLHQYKDVLQFVIFKNLPSSFWNIAVKDKHVFSWCLENTKYTHYSKVFILWQQYLHCISYKQFKPSFLLLLERYNIKDRLFSFKSWWRTKLNERLKCEILKELVLAHTKKGCNKI